MFKCISLFQVIGLVSVLAFVSGCSQTPQKSNQIDYSKYAQTIEPLETELGEEKEYEFALDLANLVVERKRYVRAEQLLMQLRRENPHDIRVYRLLTKVYEAQSKSELALVAAQEANKLNTKTIDDEAELARLALMQEKFGLADKTYRAWLKSPESVIQVSALNNLGFSALLQKKYGNAQRYFEQALKKDPLNNKALNNLKLVKTLVN